MKKKWKIIVGLLVVAAIAGGTVASIRYNRRGQITVQTGKVLRANLVEQVTASGEIKPRTYINLAANAQGRIVDLLVAEGDHVRKGQTVARIESVQAQADLDAQRAAVAAAQADATSAEAGLKVQDDNIAIQQATIERQRAQLELSRSQFSRVAELYEAKLIAKQEYDTKRADFEAQQASLREQELRLRQISSQRAQTTASINAQQRRVNQSQAQLARLVDVLARYDVVAPIDGVVTNLPVRIGETVVPGVQNSAASAVMTIADMSLITAEVKVDETDIVNLKLGQATEVAIDAVGDQKFKGHVIEIGNTAILRSTGAVASTSATSSTEAKDFKVVIALDDPPDVVRPGLSCTAKITTQTRDQALAIPIQALTVRTKGDLAAAENEGKPEKTDSQSPLDLAAEKERREEVIGVFVVADGEAKFHPVTTGISGSTNIEVTGGLSENDEIIIGPYQAIKNLRPGARVTVDNSAGVVFEQQG